MTESEHIEVVVRAAVAARAILAVGENRATLATRRQMVEAQQAFNDLRARVLEIAEQEAGR